MKMPGFVSPLPGEIAIDETHPSYWNYFGTILIGILLILFFPFGIYILIRVRIYVKTTCFVATNVRVIAKTGWLNIKQTEVRIEDIRAINVSRTFWQRMFGIGNIAIGTAATKGAEIIMRGIVDPEGFVKQVNAYRH